MNQFFAVFATDKPGVLALRQQLRATHRAYLRASDAHNVIVRLGGPTLDAAGLAMNGTLLVVEARGLAEVEQFVEADPYAQAGLFAHVEIRPWNWSLGNPELRG